MTQPAQPDTLSTVWAFEAIAPGPYRAIGFSSPESREELNQTRKTSGLSYTENTACGGTCDHCGTPIRLVCQLQGSNGKKFKVGSSCVNKSGADPNLVNTFKRELSKRNAARTKKNNRVKSLFNRAMVLMNKAQLKGLPHPKGFSGQSLFDYLVWFESNAGNAKYNKTVKTFTTNLTLTQPTADDIERVNNSFNAGY